MRFRNFQLLGHVNAWLPLDTGGLVKTFLFLRAISLKQNQLAYFGQINLCVLEFLPEVEFVLGCDLDQRVEYMLVAL